MVAAAMLSAGTVPVVAGGGAMARRRRYSANGITTAVVGLRRSGDVVSARGVAVAAAAVHRARGGPRGVSMRCRGLEARNEGALTEIIVVAKDDELDAVEGEEEDGGEEIVNETTHETTKTNNVFDDWVGRLGLMTLGGAGVFGSGFQLEGPASTAEAIAVLASIIFVHECGHFFAARLQNIHVSKFSVGFGPNLLSYQGPEVEYSLRAIPLGGFVAFPDDDPDCPYPEDDPDLLRNRPMKDRAIVVSAGVAANVAFALAILLTQVNTVGLSEQSYQPGVKVSQLLSTSAAREYGVKVGDVITAVNGETLAASGKSVNAVVDKVKAAGASTLHFDIQRRGTQGTVGIDVTPNTSPSGEGRIGVQLEANAEVHKRVAANPGEGLVLAGKEFTRLTLLVSKSLFSLVSNFQAAKENVSGPIAIVGVGAEVMRTSDLSGLYQFASVININLAVVNILPLPALDGGFLFLIAVEALRGGKKLPMEVEQSITASGVLLLLGSGMFLILRDTLNLFNSIH